MEFTLNNLIYLLTGLVYIAGIMAAVDAIFNTRTSQGAIAWSLSLLTFPFIMLPLYFILGKRKFDGYVLSRKRGCLDLQHYTQDFVDKLDPDIRISFEQTDENLFALEKLAYMSFSRYNNAELLIDGEQTFAAIFESLEQATSYVLVQFYIVNNDALGRKFQQSLIDCATRGVRVYLLYDRIGSYSLPRSYVEALEAVGVVASAFTGNGAESRDFRFQINFRNHRKIVVIDGRTALVGGLNIGDEYLGLDPHLSPWRDTHTRITGPAALGVQLSFLEDWYWMRRELPALNWQPVRAEEDQRILVLPSGPSDELETCGLLFTQLINMARERIWIVSPYFVPDESVINALQLAVLRGVDVRIILPEKVDHTLVYLASFSYLEETLPYGIKVFRYVDGFLHKKVVLVDEVLAGVGTANLDNRSFRLNFEITLLFADLPMIKAVETMLMEDLEHCRLLEMEDFTQRSFTFKFLVKLARLFSPAL